MTFKTTNIFRVRYIIGLLIIACLATASYLTLQRIVSQQRDFAKVVNMAGHQSGLINRVAYFASLMATTNDEADFKMARSQVGRTLHKLKNNHQTLLKGDQEQGIPRLHNENIEIIFEDPTVGLDRALKNYFERAWAVYDKPMDKLNTFSVEFIFLTTYGPHVLEPMFDAAVEELEIIGRNSILKIERLELIIWLSTLVALVLEAILIFHPLQRKIEQSLATLENTIDELKDTREEILKERSFLQNVIDGVIDPILVINSNNEILRLNHAAKKIVNLHGLEDISVTLTNYKNQSVEEAHSLSASYKTVIKHPRYQDTQKVYEVAISPLIDEEGNIQGIIESSRDITEQQSLLENLKRSQSNFAHLAQHDSLTGLPNRLLFNDRLNQAIHSAHRKKRKLALLFIDLDGFKNVNDSFDHSFGDEVLKQTADRLNVLIREDDTIARMGGDEFTIILNGINSPQDAAIVAQKILGVFQEPFDIQNKTAFLGASIGISIYPKHGKNSEDLIRHADAAMYRSKEEGRNTFSYYSEGMTEKVLQRITLESDLRKALENEELIIHYQPQYRLSDNKLVGFEALLRWKHPEKGMMPPVDFIDIAEDSGLIVPIGQWVLSMSCYQMNQWLEQKLVSRKAVMSVNISAKQFDMKHLVDDVRSILTESGLPPENLELEITESTVMRSIDNTKSILKKFRNLGVKLAVDDFGTGYSSLSYLKLLPITKLKIDKSFVTGIPKDKDDVAITQAIIGLGKSLSFEIIAEGVETQKQVDFLCEESCDLGQGYFFSKPLPTNELEKIIFR